MDNYFSKLNDRDFYSNKLTHIYFNSTVSDESIDELIEKVKQANNIENPKPILIHICSFGGNLKAGLRFLTIFKTSKMPIATIIDNYSCSAATFLSVSSPYRVMNKYGYCLLHEYSINGFINDKRNYFVNSIREIDNYFNIIIEMYLKKTNYKRDELMELLQHNLFLDYKTCLSKKIVDRVIDFKDNYSDIPKINIHHLLNNNKDVIHMPLSCDFNSSNIDLSIFTSNVTDIKKPYLIYPIHEECNNIDKKKEEKKNLITTDVLNEKNIFKTLNVIPRITSINNLKIGIIDTPISIDNLLPLLFTDKIYMYKHTFIVCNLIYFYNMNNSILIDDNLKNTKCLMTAIKTILKKKTKMKLADIKMINRRFLILDSKTSKDWGLCHEIIDV
jgi:ATP-dependent protease ClpP protease subunit